MVRCRISALLGLPPFAAAVPGAIAVGAGLLGSAPLGGCRLLVSVEDLRGGAGGVSAGTGGDGSSLTAGGTSGAGSTGGTGGARSDAGADGAMDAASDGDALDASPGGLILVRKVPGELRGIAVFQDDLYWVEAGPGGGVFRAPKLGDASSVVRLRATAKAVDVAADGTSVYWAEPDTIYEMPSSGSSTTTPTIWGVLGSLTARRIAVDDQGAVYATTFQDRIAYAKSGSAFVPYVDQPGASGIAFLPDLFWGYDAGVREGPASRGGGIVNDLLTPGTDPVQGVASDGNYVFWIKNSREVRRTSIRGASGAASLCLEQTTDLGANPDIAVDARWVYFTQPNLDTIWKCLKE